MGPICPEKAMLFNGVSRKQKIHKERCSSFFLEFMIPVKPLYLVNYFLNYLIGQK